MVRDGRFWCRIGVSARFAGLVADTLDLLAAQQIPARYERIGQRAGYEQAMRDLLQPAIAHLGEAEHPFDDPERMFNSPLSRGQATGPHFGLGAIFRSLDLIHNSAVAVSDDRAGGHLRSLRRQMPLRLVEPLPAQRLLHRFLSDPIAEAIADGARGAGLDRRRPRRGLSPAPVARAGLQDGISAASVTLTRPISA